jgi:hypothetical protein
MTGNEIDYANDDYPKTWDGNTPEKVGNQEF